MRQFNRPTALKIAAVLTVLVAAYAIPFYDIPSLMQGADNPVPFWLALGSFASDVLALVAAYGTWRGHKWGVVLLLGVMAYWFVQSIGGLAMATDAGEIIFSGGMFIHHLIVVGLCFWPERATTKVAS
jgi:hypothetical protein